MIVAVWILAGIFLEANCEEIKNGEIKPLVGLFVSTSNDFLVKNQDNVLVCDFENSELSKNLLLSDVRWLRDGRFLDTNAHLDINANGPVLQLFAQQKSFDLEGDYQCQATLKSSNASIGPVLSSAYRLFQVHIEKFQRRNELDSLSVQFETVEAVQGEIAYLPCLGMPESVPGPPKIHFERKFPAKMLDSGLKEKNLVVLRSNRPGEVFQDRYLITDGGLQIAVVQPSDAGRYRCLAQNPFTNQTRRSKIWIHLKVAKTKSGDKDKDLPASRLRMTYPRIKETRKTVQVGDPVILDCVGGGGQIVWDKLNDSNWRQNLDGGPEGKSRFVKIWGNLKLIYAKPEDAGVYSCSLVPPVKDEGETPSRDQPSGWSPPAALYHLSVPGEPRADLKADKLATGNLRVRCGGQGSEERPQLVLNSQSILTTQGLNILDYQYSSKTGEQYLIGEPLPSGALQCVVPPGEGRFRRGHTSSVYLTPSAQEQTPDERIEIEQGPDDSTRMIGEWVTMICKVKGTRRVEWLKDGSKLSIEANPRLELIGSGSLDIRDVKESDSGLYTCVAVGSKKNETAKARLTVESLFGIGRREELPSVELDDDDYDYGESEKTTTGSTDIDFSTIPSENEQNLSTTTTATTESPLAVEFSGSGQTPTSDDWWEGTTKATVIIVTTPKKRRPLKIDAPKVYQHGSQSSMMVQWSIPGPEKLPGRLVHVKVQRKEQGTDRWFTLDQNLPPNVRQHTVHDLEVGKSYKFRIGLAFANGETISSKTTKYHELKRVSPNIRKPSAAPVIVEVKSLSANAIEVRWTYPDGEVAHLDGFIISHRVRYAGRNFESKLYNVTAEGSHTREHVLEGLVPAAPYDIYMVAFNSAGQSAESEIVTGQTLNDTKDYIAITDLKIDSVTAETTEKMDGSLPSDSFLPTEKSSEITTTIFNNATILGDKERKLLFSLDSKTLLIFLGAVLLLLILTLIFCMIYCTLRQRKQAKINEAAKGKFLDTSRRIYKEQKLKDGNLSLYYDAMTVSISKDDSARSPNGAEAMTTSTLLFQPRRSPNSGRYSPEPSPERPPTPIVAAVKPMRNGNYRHSSPPAQPRSMRIYGNPMMTASSPPPSGNHANPRLPPTHYRGESSEPEDDALMMLVAGGAPKTRRKVLEGPNGGRRGWDEEPEIGLIDTDDEMSGGKQGSTPECDIRDGPPSPYHSAYPPPPTATSLANQHGIYTNGAPVYANYNPHQHPAPYIPGTNVQQSHYSPVAVPVCRSSYLSPYHQALAATEPARLGSAGNMAGSDGSSPYGPGHLSLNTSGTTGSGESASGSPRSGSRSRTPQVLTPAHHGHPVTSTPSGQSHQRPTSQGPAGLGPAYPPPPPSAAGNQGAFGNGSTSPLIPQKDWDIMWTRGGSATNLGRSPSDRSSSRGAGEEPPHFYTFRPPANSGNASAANRQKLGVPAFRPATQQNYGTYDSNRRRQADQTPAARTVGGYLSDS